MNTLVRYRALIAALVGIISMLVLRNTGFDLGPHEQIITDVVIAALSAFGVLSSPKSAEG